MKPDFTKLEKSQHDSVFNALMKEKEQAVLNAINEYASQIAGALSNEDERKLMSMIDRFLFEGEE